VLGWTVPVIAGLSGISVLAAALAGWRSARPLPHGLLLVALVAAALWTAPQAVPIPCGLASWIAPESAEHTARTAELFGIEPRCTVTEDPGRTREEVLKALTLVSLFVAASFVSSIAKRDAVLRVVALACTAVAVAALGHTVLDAHAIWGLYEPIHGNAQLGPFVNPNHLGGVMAMGAPVAFGLASSSRHRDQRAPWMLASVPMLGVMALSLSRGAVLAVLVGLTLFGVLTARGQAQSMPSTSRTAWERFLLRPATLAVLPLVLGLAVIASAAGLERFARDLSDTDHSKLEVALRALTLEATGPWVGVGRGAFAVAYEIGRAHV
jgi:hypothetical protein